MTSSRSRSRPTASTSRWEGFKVYSGFRPPWADRTVHKAECGGCNVVKRDWNNVGPNIGFTWDPTKSGKWSVAAAYRVAYDRVGLVYHLLQDSLSEGSTASRTIFPGGRFTDVARYVPLPRPNCYGPIPNRRQGFVLAYDPNLAPLTHRAGRCAFRGKSSVERCSRWTSATKRPSSTAR